MNDDEIKNIVRQTYLKILKREPDIDGLNYFSDLMNKGELNEEKLENILINSDEFVGYKQKKSLPVKENENLTKVP